MKKIDVEMFFYWALCLVLITLPFPKYSLNSQSIIVLFISWLFYNSGVEKLTNLKKNWKPFILISSVFWLSIIGLLYTSNFEYAKEVIIQNLPFLIFPLVFFTTLKGKRIMFKALKLFSFSVVLASLFAVSKAIYFKINNLGDFFYYTEFSRLLEIHTTYFALYVVITIVFFINDILNTKKINLWLSILTIGYLLLILYMVSSRISLVALFVAGSLLIFFNYKKIKTNKSLFLIAPMGLLVFIVFMVSPNFQNRNSGVSEFGYHPPKLESRGVHWKAVLNTIHHHNWLIGNGTGDGHEGLFEAYRKIGFESGYQNKYNAHNQFLENMLCFGVLGLISLLSLFAYVLYNSIKSHDFISFIITIIFLIFMITESLLVRHSGVVLFSLLMTLCLIEDKERSYGMKPKNACTLCKELNIIK